MAESWRDASEKLAPETRCATFDAWLQLLLQLDDCIVDLAKSEP